MASASSLYGLHLQSQVATDALSGYSRRFLSHDLCAERARTHTSTSLQHYSKYDSAADAMCYTYQTHTAKPMPTITTDITMSSNRTPFFLTLFG
jgi:hypothetical protein